MLLIILNNTQENTTFKAEEGSENSPETIEQVASQLTSKIIEQTDSSIKKASTRFGMAKSMGMTEDSINESKKMLSPVQQKMKELEVEYTLKFAEVVGR